MRIEGIPKTYFKVDVMEFVKITFFSKILHIMKANQIIMY